MSQAPNTQQPSIALPVIALVGVFVCWPIGLVLAIVSLVKYSSFNGSTAKTLAIVALALNLVLIPMAGIMAAIAIPNFVKFQCRSKQSEAKMNLKSLYVGEEGYRAEHDTYSADQAAVSFRPAGAKLRYQYAIVDASKTAFHAEARGSDDMEGDLWVIDQTGRPQNTVSKCGMGPSP